MAAEDSSYGDGPFSAAGDDAQPEQPPLVAIKPRGRPSNWAKKFALQQMKDSQQTNSSAQKNDSQREQAQTQASKSPTPETVPRRKSTRTRVRKPKGGIYSPGPVEPAPMAVTPQVLVTPGPSKSPSPTSQPTVDDENELSVIRDDDSLFEGDAGSLFGGDDEPERFTRAPSHTDSLFVGDDEPAHTQPSRPTAPVGDRRSPFLEINEPVRSQPATPNEQAENHGSLFGGNNEAAQSLLALSTGQGGNRSSPFCGSDEAARSQATPPGVQDDVRSSRSRKSHEPAESSRLTPSNGSQRTNVSAELATMADEVRRWEAVTQQVATSTAEMSALIKDLASQSFASRPPSASVRDMLSPEDQARFRDQLLKATQLSLKADLVQTLKERDSEARQMQVYCVVVLAVAVVLAAFMVSPFAGPVAEWLEWAVLGG